MWGDSPQRMVSSRCVAHCEEDLHHCKSVSGGSWCRSGRWSFDDQRRLDIVIYGTTPLGGFFAAT